MRGPVFCRASSSAYLICLLHLAVWVWIAADQVGGSGKAHRVCHREPDRELLRSFETATQVRRELVEKGRIRHGLFFVHLSVEKLLKAHLCRATEDFPSKIHSLPRLAQETELSFTTEQKNILAELTRYNIAGRYPDMLEPLPDRATADRIVEKAERIYQWLIERL